VRGGKPNDFEFNGMHHTLGEAKTRMQNMVKSKRISISLLSFHLLST